MKKMRTKQDINAHQCEHCNKIQKEEEFTNVDGEGWCDKCVIELENKQEE